MPRSDKEKVGRAAKRAEWASTALDVAADDLTEASESGALDGLSEVVHEEAATVSRIAEDIESRMNDDQGVESDPAAWGKKGGSAKRRAS
jgi:hypothetical protein